MVELRSVSKQYGAAAALSEIDLTVAKGEFVTLLGPSGSGKTTLLNIIAGMAQPTSGQVVIDGRDATHLAPSERGLGMVFQNYALMPHMTVFDNIAFPLRVRKMARAQIEQKVHDVLKLIRLPDIAQRRPRELSGGQQQRVSLARCIVYNPSLILLDEPLGALDKKLREQMQLEIKRIHSELGITMLNVTHDQDEALTLSDRIVLMNGGRIEQQCAPADLYFRPRTVFAADFMGEANLFPATLRAIDGDTVRLDSPVGELQAMRPDFLAGEGAGFTVLVRPENVTMSTSAAPGANVVRGTLRDSIVLSGVVKHYVSLAGREVIVQEANHARRRTHLPGHEVFLTWNWRDALVLPAQ
ncbi:ABC transporter ATP-binding protein [Caenimonas sp. S4]|nr:ABC transporter ATP-binding protein [Caenimonas soli]